MVIETHNTFKTIMSGDGIMRKALALFMVTACVVVAVVMYMYWNRETEVVTHGVLVSNDTDVAVNIIFADGVIEHECVTVSECV